jgi:chromosome segregation ATPase
MDDIFLTDLELARKERNDAIARAEAAEGEVARMRVWQGHPDDLWEARCTVVIDDGMVVVGGTQKAVDETVRQLRRRVTAEAEVERLREELSALRARVEAAEADAAECRSERARYGDMMTDKLAAAEAASAYWRELHGDRDHDLQHEYARANEAEAEVARLREALADIAEAADADDPESYDFSKEK